MSVPSSELAPTAPSPGTKWGRQHSLAGEGTEGSQFGRPERKPGTLFALCIELFKNSYVSIIKGHVRALVFDANSYKVRKTKDYNLVEICEGCIHFDCTESNIFL